MIEYLTEQEVLNMDTNYIIETKNLTKQYGSQKSVADLNIHVKPGDSIKLPIRGNNFFSFPCKGFPQILTSPEVGFVKPNSILCCFFLWRVKRVPVFMAGAFVILLDFKSKLIGI